MSGVRVGPERQRGQGLRRPQVAAPQGELEEPGEGHAGERARLGSALSLQVVPGRGIFIGHPHMTMFLF